MHLPWFTAIEHIGPALQGTKNPHFFVCESDAGFPREMLVKQMSVPMMVREILGNLFARVFGLATPEPAIICIKEEVVGAVDRWSLATNRYSPFHEGLACGCTRLKVGANVSQFGAVAPAVAADLRRMVFFDVLFGYGDRTPQNPNCGMATDGLLVFDFEQLFGDRSIDGNPEAEAGLEDWEHVLRLHAFGGQVRLAPGSREDIMHRFEELRGTDWRTAIGKMPEAWHPDAEEVVRMMRQVDGERIIPQIERRLR